MCGQHRQSVGFSEMHAFFVTNANAKTNTNTNTNTDAEWNHTTDIPKYGWNAINFASGKALRAIMPFIFLIILVCNFYLAFIHTIFIALFVSQVCLYSLVIIINIFHISPKLNAVKLICYLINGYWVALKGSLKYILGLQEKIWTKI